MPVGQATAACVALTSVLALILALSWIRQRLLPVAANRGGPALLRVRETLSIDARRRLHLIEVEGGRALLLTGGTGDVLVPLVRAPGPDAGS